jgi:transcriptional regulator with XRE-family HTH domain
MSIGTRLKSERKRLGMIQADFAAACGITRNTQGFYETGTRSPDAEYLSQASRLGVDVHYVIAGGEQHPDPHELMNVKLEIPLAYAVALQHTLQSVIRKAQVTHAA